MKRNKNNKPNEYIDDGHTIYDMNVDASWNNKKEKSPIVMVSKEERWTLIKAAFLAYPRRGAPLRYYASSQSS